MAADGIVEAAGDQQTLFGARAAAEGGPQQRDDLAQGPGANSRRRRRAKHGGARRTLEQVGRLHEAVGGVDPARLRHRAGAQEHQPRRTGARGRRFQPRAERVASS